MPLSLLTSSSSDGARGSNGSTIQRVAIRGATVTRVQIRRRTAGPGRTQSVRRSRVQSAMHVTRRVLRATRRARSRTHAAAFAIGAVGMAAGVMLIVGAAWASAHIHTLPFP